MKSNAKAKTLHVTALGPLRLAIGENPINGWRYSDSPELLIYLLCYARTRVSDKKSQRTLGRTREQIGLALWTNASTDQVRSNLKARLHDLRQKLGAREWVRYDDERYSLDERSPLVFDVVHFEDACIEGEALARQGNSSRAISVLTRASSLYQGEFLEGYQPRAHTRLDDEDDGEYEWYIAKRRELENHYHAALTTLGGLLAADGQYTDASIAYQKIIAQDETNFDAHTSLLQSLLASGWRSQARQHAKWLASEPTLPALPKTLTEIVDQILRGNFPTPSTAPAAPPQTLPASNNIPLRPFQVPRDLKRFVGRSTTLQSLARKIKRASTAEPICLVGMGGVGKTSLAVHLAHQLRTQFPDGVLWGNLAASEPLTILESWAKAFGHDYSTLPDLEARAAALRALLANKKILFILDDVWDASKIRPLLVGGKKHRVIVTTRDTDLAYALNGSVTTLEGFATKESLELCISTLGAARIQQTPDAVAEMCHLLGQLPLAIDIVVQRLASRPRWSVPQLVSRLRTQIKRLDELQLGDRAVRASFLVSWDALSEAQKKAFAALGVFGGRSFSAPAFAQVAEMEQETQLLDDLVALSLLSTDAEARYKQHPLLADFAFEKLANREESQARFADYFLTYATKHRGTVMALDEEWDNLNAGLELAHQLKLSQKVLAYSDVLTDAWVTRGHFSDARRAYPLVIADALELEEQEPYIEATLNWGRVCIDQSDYGEAETHLLHGLQTSREVRDEFHTATGLSLLARLAIVRSRYDEAEPCLAESQSLFEKLNNSAGLAQVLYLRARLHMQLREYAAAEQVGQQSLQLYQQIEPNHGRIVMLRFMGRIQDYLDHVDEALEYVHAALDLAKTLNDLGEYASALFELASILRYRQQFAQARSYAQEAVALFEKMGDRKTKLPNVQLFLRIILR